MEKLTEDKKPRGFAAMTKERRREVSSLGGKSVPDSKRGFSTNRELASRAGKKGGAAVEANKRSFSQDRELARRAGSTARRSSPTRKALT